VQVKNVRSTHAFQTFLETAVEWHVNKRQWAP
jgi:hypothetical protein